MKLGAFILARALREGRKPFRVASLR